MLTKTLTTKTVTKLQRNTYIDKTNTTASQLVRKKWLNLSKLSFQKTTFYNGECRRSRQQPK